MNINYAIRKATHDVNIAKLRVESQKYNITLNLFGCLLEIFICTTVIVVIAYLNPMITTSGIIMIDIILSMCSLGLDFIHEYNDRLYHRQRYRFFLLHILITMHRIIVSEFHMYHEILYSLLKYVVFLYSNKKIIKILFH
jgi:hypothetical protein